MAETPEQTQQESQQEQKSQTPTRPSRVRPWVLRLLLAANAGAAVALALAFQASSSDLQIVTDETAQPATMALCIQGQTAYKGNANGTIYANVGACPEGAQSAAVVTSDYPMLFKIALVIMAVSSGLQVLMVRTTD